MHLTGRSHGRDRDEVKDWDARRDRRGEGRKDVILHGDLEGDGKRLSAAGLDGEDGLGPHFDLEKDEERRCEESDAMKG